MQHVWLYVSLFVLLLIVPFIASPPTFVSNKFFDAFEIHPTLTESAVISVTWRAESIMGDDRRSLLRDFNMAAFLTRRYSTFPTYHQDPIYIRAMERGKETIYMMYPYGDAIDIVKQRGKKTIVYQVKSSAIQRRFVSAIEEINAVRESK